MTRQPIQAPSAPPVSCLSGGSGPLVETARREDHQRMLPDPGCYEERYRLNGRAALGLAAGLLSVGLGILWRTPVIFTAIALLVAIPAVIALARRTMAFRADHAGITLGAVSDKLTFRRGQAVFVPWADVEQIILYPASSRGQGPFASAQCIGVQRRDRAPALLEGDEQAPGCQVPGVAIGATRRRLDRERLATVTAAMAPEIPILDASPAPDPGVEGPGQGASAPEPRTRG
jgi:hypothetical protein